MSKPKKKKKFSKRIKILKKKIQRQKRLLFWVNFLFVFFVGMIIFLPPIYSEVLAKSGIGNVDRERSGLTQAGFWSYLWHPEYIFLSNNEEEDQVHVYYKTVNRKYLFWWQVDESKSNSFVLDGVTTEELEDKLLIPHTANDDDEKVSFSQDIFSSDEAAFSPGSVLKEIEDPRGQRKIQVIVGNSPDENTISLDGKTIEALTNVSNVQFDLEGTYIYFSRYDVEQVDGENELRYSGLISRWNIAEEIEEAIYDFGEGEYISFKANQTKIAYTLVSGQVGVVDLESREKSVIDVSQFSVPLENSGTEIGNVPIVVIDIDPETAMFEISSGADNDGEGEYFRVNLNDLNVIID